MTKRRKRLLMGAGVLVLSAAALLGHHLWLSRSEAQAQGTRLLPVHTVPVKAAGTVEVRRGLTGTLRARRRSELGFPAGGRVVEVVVSRGERVTEGQILARLDPRHLEARRQELLARQAELAAEEGRLVAGPRKETVAAARAELRALEHQLELARRELEREEGLRDADVVAVAATDQVRYRALELAARAEAAGQRLRELELGTRAEVLAAHRARQAQVAAALEQVEADLEDAVLQAPYAGVVSLRHVDEGAVVGPGAPVVRLVEVDRLEAHVGVPAAEVPRFNPGSEVELEVDGLAFAGRLAAVLPEVDPATRTATLRVDVDGRQDPVRLRPGRLVRLVLRYQQEVEGVWVPVGALTRSTEGLWAVYGLEAAADGGFRVVAHPVEVLRTDGDRALCRGTLAPGDDIVDSADHRVTLGQRVRKAVSP